VASVFAVLVILAIVFVVIRKKQRTNEGMITRIGLENNENERCQNFNHFV